MGSPSSPSLPPSGVVTFLLSDVVGSSSLWETSPTAMAHALARHDAIIRQAVESYSGVLLKARGEGDSTFSVFQRATDAIHAARAIHLGLGVEQWPDDARLVVRMAVHTGEAIERDGDYYGPTVNRVARLRDRAEGGQVLLSQATATLVLDRLPADCSVADLGVQLLRGLSRPETVFELEVDRPTDRHAPQPSAPGEPPSVGPVPLPSRLDAMPLAGFHGRTAELGILNRRLDETRRGKMRVVLVSGEPGIGKSALAAEVARTAHANGTVVLYGRCDEDALTPYKPWADALGHLLTHASPTLLAELGPRRRADLVHLVPDIADPDGRLGRPARSDAQGERYLLFGAVASALRAAASGTPVLLILDDLQWADTPTLLLLRHLVGLSDAPPLLVIGNYRDVELPTDHPLNDVLAALRREPGVDRLSLTGLSDSELVELVETVSGQPMSGPELELLHALHRETDGNPFFAWEIMLHLNESGLVGLSDDGHWVAHDKLAGKALPASIREVIGRRVARLGPSVQRALATASVFGRDFDLDLLADVLGEDSDTVLEQLETAEAAGLVSSLAHDRFTFTHALIAHSLYADLTPTRRARAHHHIAETIERLGAVDANVADLARHWASSGEAGAAEAVGYAKRAAEKAMAALAPDEASRWYHQALTLHDQSPAADPALRCDLLTGLGEAQVQSGNPGFHETLMQAATLAQQLGDPERLVLAALANNRGIPGYTDPERVSLLEAALLAVGDGDSSARARLLACLSSELLVGGDYERRRSLADEALAVARRLGDPITLLHVLDDVTTAISVPSTRDERLELTRETVELADALDNPVMGCFGRLQRIQAFLEGGQLAEADDCLGRLQSLAEELGQPVLLWMATWARCSRAVTAGDIPTAEVLAAEALQLGMDSGQPDAMTIYSGQLFCIRWHQGRDDELLALMTEVAAARPDLPVLQAAVARIKADTGAPELCHPAALESLPYDIAWAAAMAVWAEVAARVGTPEACAVLYDRLSAYPDYVIHLEAVSVGAVSHYLGILAVALGRIDEARVHFAEAERIHQQLDAPFHLARTWLEWGSAVLGAGETADEAVELLTRSREMASRFGCSAVERRAADLLAAS